jgi:hypothetical protein
MLQALGLGASDRVLNLERLELTFFFACIR